MRKNQPANTRLPTPAQTGRQGLQRLSKRGYDGSMPCIWRYAQ
jgi:hypothetical protein